MCSLYILSSLTDKPVEPFKLAYAVWSGVCFVFVRKTAYCHSASPLPGVLMGTSKYAEGSPAMD